MNELVSPVAKVCSSRIHAVRRARNSARRVALITMKQTRYFRSAALVALIGATALPLTPLFAQDMTAAPAAAPAMTAPATSMAAPPVVAAPQAAPAISDSGSSSLFPKVAVPDIMAPAPADSAANDAPANAVE